MCEMAIKCFFPKIWAIDEPKRFFHSVYEAALLNTSENFSDLTETLSVENVRNRCDTALWNSLTEEKKEQIFLLSNKCERALRQHDAK